MNIKLLIIIVVLQYTNGVDITCNFRAETWYNELHYSYNGMSPDLYECRNTNGEIKSMDDDMVTSIRGDHLNGRKNRDVVSFDSDDKIINFFPRKLSKHFENLKSIRIKNAQLRKLHEQDLQPFWDLRLLCLSNNKIENLERDVFKHNQRLEYLSLDSNSIQFVSIGSFDDLHVLKSLLFRGNSCYSDLAFYDRNGVVKLVDNIEKNCNYKYKDIRELLMKIKENQEMQRLYETGTIDIKLT